MNGNVTMSETFGQYIARRRRAAGLKQGELARRINVTPAYLRQLERDRNPAASINGEDIRPPVEVVDQIAKATGTPLAEMRLAAGHAAPEEIRDGEPKADGVFDRSDFAALYRKYENLPRKDKRGFKRILLMIDRELDRLQEK